MEEIATKGEVSKNVSGGTDIQNSDFGYPQYHVEMG